MAEAPNRIEGGLFEQDSNTRRFHLGSLPQAGIPDDLTEEEEQALDLHRHQIKTPQDRERFEGEPVPTQGLVIDDQATGATRPLEVDKRGRVKEPTAAEKRQAQEGSRAESASEMSGKAPGGSAGDKK